MCGRFLLNSPLVELQRAFRFPERPNLGPRYNVAPTQTVPIVRRRRGRGRARARPRPLGPGAVLGQGSLDREQDDQRPGGGDREQARLPGGVKARRCLVPADGFYEWQKVEGGKQPMLIRLRSMSPSRSPACGRPGAGPTGPSRRARSSRRSRSRTAPIHNRMPVILEPADYDRWLDPSQPGAQALLRPCPDEWLEAYPVSTRVNTPRNDSADSDRADPEPGLKGQGREVACPCHGTKERTSARSTRSAWRICASGTSSPRRASECRHQTELTTGFLTWERVPHTYLTDLERKLRCTRCGNRQGNTLSVRLVPRN